MIACVKCVLESLSAEVAELYPFFGFIPLLLSLINQAVLFKSFSSFVQKKVAK